jgi:hypothetical protein
MKIILILPIIALTWSNAFAGDNSPQVITLPGTASVSVSGTIATTNTNVASGSANPFDITSALGIMNGSDDYTAIDINLTNADHTGSNTIQGLDISSITGDAQLLKQRST